MACCKWLNPCRDAQSPFLLAWCLRRDPRGGHRVRGLCAKLPGQGSRLNQGNSQFFPAVLSKEQPEAAPPQNTLTRCTLLPSSTPASTRAGRLDAFFHQQSHWIHRLRSFLIPSYPCSADRPFFLRVSREVPHPIRAHLPPNTLCQDAKKNYSARLISMIAESTPVPLFQS